MFKMRFVMFFLFVLVISFVNGLPKCSKFEFPCENGECIDSDLWCDSKKNCADASDEKYCKKNGIYNKNPNKCPSAYFKCSNGPCIPLSGRCDGYNNCADSSDERNCDHLNFSESGSVSPPSQYESPSSEIKTTKEATLSTTRKPSLKSEDSQFPDSPDTLEHSSQVLYSDLSPSDYTRQRELARNWLLSQRRSDFGWKDETARALTALYLSDVQQYREKNESDMLMVKQLEVELSLDMARNGTKSMKMTNLAFYINALQVSCKDPKNFYGENLVRTLRNAADNAQRVHTFVNPSVYLTLCMNNATTYEDARRVQEILLARDARTASLLLDIQALALLTSKCMYQNTDFLTSQMFDDIKRKFLHKMSNKGIPGNVYEASLLAQALQGLNESRPGILEYILKQQQEDGSFGGILATYLVLPVLAGRSFLHMNNHCEKQYIADPFPIEVLKHLKRRKIFIQYALHYGYPPEIIETIKMQVAEGINFLDIMRLAQEINPKYRFLLDGNRDVPVVYSIGGIPNDAEKGMFWTLFTASSGHRIKGDTARFSPYPGDIKRLVPQHNDELVFWMRSI